MVRDEAEFPEYFAARGTFGIREAACAGPIKYIGQSAVQVDVSNLRTALEGAKVEEAFLPAVAPGTIEHWLKNEYYSNDDAYLSAIAARCMKNTEPLPTAV